MENHHSQLEVNQPFFKHNSSMKNNYMYNLEKHVIQNPIDVKRSHNKQ